MKIVSHAVRVAIAGGLVAGSVAIATADQADAAVTTVGTCSGTRAIASAKSTFIWPGDGKAAGITDKDHDGTVSAKGIHAIGGVVGTIGGSCTFSQAVAFDKGITKTPADTKTLLKWSSKTVTPTVDCTADTDADEWPLSGKLSYAWDDALKTDAYVTVANPTGSPTDVVNLTGVVTKGVAVGAQVDSAVSYTPVVKDKLVTVDYPGYSTETVAKVLSHYLNAVYDFAPIGPGAEDHIPTPNDITASQGYKMDNVANLATCQGVTEPALEAANLRLLQLGTDAQSPLLGSAVAGTTFTIGAP